MERLQMCRMCLVEDATMYVVVNKNLLVVYEMLTGKPFVTEDRRPVLVCYICCSKLKECCRFQKKCLEAEKLFAQMLNKDYEPNPLINPDILEFNNGFVISPMEHINIMGENQTEIRGVKEVLTADFERLADIIELKEELQVDELEKPDPSAVEDILLQHSDSEYDALITVFKTEVEEHDTNWAPVAKKPKLQLQKTKLKDTKEEQKKNEQTGSKVMNFKDPLNYTKPRVNNTIYNSKSVNNTTLDKKICKNGNEDDIRCKLTNKGKDSDDINSHRKLSVKGKPYKCEVCHQSFNQKNYLTTHIRIHTGEKPYKCEVCHRSFKQKAHLTTHILIHTGEKPYKCEVCHLNFNRKNHLTTHIRIHTGEKPYKCEVCHHSFNRKNHLTRHIRIHTGEKPYKCEVCHRSFSRKSILATHIQIH